MLKAYRGDFVGIYVFYGEEDFLRDYNSDKIISGCNLTNLDMNLIKLNEDNIERLPDNCEQVPFLDSKKVIYVKNSGFFTSGKKIAPSIVERVTEYLLLLPEYVEVVFNEESIDKRLLPYKKLSKIAKFEEMKYRSETDLTNWICSGIKRCGASIDVEDARYLAQVCGPSMSYLHSEVRKLAVLNKEGVKINKILIDEVSTKSIQGIIFDLTDAIGTKNKAMSIKLLEELILKKETEQFILIMLYKHFRNLFLLKVATDEGIANANDLGINPYVYRKLLGQVKNYSESSLRYILSELMELDYKSKRGTIDLRTGIELIICCA